MINKRTGLAIIAAILCFSGCSGGGGGGKSCTASAGCDEGQYCKFEDGACAGSGSCTDLDLICTQELAPVCSCDSLTFNNSCFLGAAGQSLRSQGNCP